MTASARTPNNARLRVARTVAILAALLIFGPVDRVDARPRTKDQIAAERGRLIAQRHCAACHAVGPGQESPNTRAPAFHSLEMRHTASLEGRLNDLTRRGHYEMPPISLQPTEVADLLAYIRSFDARSQEE